MVDDIIIDETGIYYTNTIDVKLRLDLIVEYPRYREQLFQSLNSLILKNGTVTMEGDRISLITVSSVNRCFVDANENPSFSQFLSLYKKLHRNFIQEEVIISMIE